MLVSQPLSPHLSSLVTMRQLFLLTVLHTHSHGVLLCHKLNIIRSFETLTPDFSCLSQAFNSNHGKLTDISQGGLTRPRVLYCRSIPQRTVGKHDHPFQLLLS